MPLSWKQATVTKKEVWTDGLFTLTVDVPGVQPFIPGQFLQLGVNDGEKHIHRPYSVASPHGKELEFYIVLVPEGLLTPKLWAMDVGSQLDVSEKAAGSFTLKKTPEASDLWLIATGTGLAPYIAMLRTEEPWQRYANIRLVHGVRYQRDLAYLPELEEMQAQHADTFKYLPIPSREKVDGMLTGRIPKCVDDGSLEDLAECRISAADSALLLCGNPQMLDDMEEMMGQRGLKRHRSKAPGQIVLERYW